MQFEKDNRGQSIVLGALLMFAVIIAFIGLLQTVAVPQIVSDSEQAHAERVDNEFTQIYTSAADAVGSNSDRSTTITLGTRPENVPFLVMPSPSSGDLYSNNEGDLEGDGGSEFDDLNQGLVEDICGLDTVPTKSLHYSASYNEYRDAGTYTYETKVKYKRTNRNTIGARQDLIDQNDAGTFTSINLAPITHGSIQESGSSARSVTFKSGETGTSGVFGGDEDNPVEIKIPVHDDDAWKDTFDGYSNINVTVYDEKAIIRLNDTSQDYQISCTPVGIDTRPQNKPTTDFQGDNGDDDSPFNPIGTGALVLTDSSSNQMVFTNNAPTKKTVTDVRIPWVLSPGKVDGDLRLEPHGSGDSVDVPPQSSQWTDISGNWVWEPEDEEGDEKTIDVTDTGGGEGEGGGDPNTGYAVVFKFEDGTTSTYLISGS